MDLERLAVKEILREAKRAVARSEVSGLEGFKKCPLPRTNKRFLTNTIVNNLKSNKFKEAKKEKNLSSKIVRTTQHSKENLSKKNRSSKKFEPESEGNRKVTDLKKSVMKRRKRKTGTESGGYKNSSESKTTRESDLNIKIKNSKRS